MSRITISVPNILQPLFLFVLISIPFEVICQSSNTEQSILLSLKQQWGNPPSIQAWSSSTSPCDWPEINCSDGTVTEISLADKNITEKIPATICDLKNLTKLNLTWNFIPGEFPKAVYNCSKLQILDLSQNCFVGPLPKDIDRLSSLQFLDVGANNFSGDIPAAIGNLTELKELYLYQNLFNGTFPSEIGNLSNLEVLSMPFNDELVPAPIPPEFGKLQKLKFLWMKRSNLIGFIPESLTELRSLEHLDFSHNNLVGTIPSGLFMLKNLSRLYLFKNRLSEDIPRTIEALKLEQIDLSMNNLTGSIPEDFAKLKNLTILSLFWNQLSGQIPVGLGLLPNLKNFRIFNNKLNGTLPPELGLHSKLESFEVANNQLIGQLPENLCANGVLQGAVAFSNSLSGELPEGLGNCSTLRTVQLYKNNFSGEVPPGLWMTLNLSSLMLSDNSFSGQLPSKLASNMTRLEISNNKFSGQIPAGVSTWETMIVFKASSNLFSGQIPIELTSLSRLTTISLDDNQLSGEFPSQIISWKSLNTLNLSRNELSGQISVAIGSLPDLDYLDLSRNQLSGTIPLELGNLKLSYLDLSFNKLSGKIPSEFDNLAYENSFMNNSNLCSNAHFLDLPTCRTEHHGSKKLSSPVLAIILVLAITVFVATVSLTVYIVKQYRRKKHSQDVKTWKLTSFHRLDFTEFNVLTNLTENNVVGSGGSGKVYRISTNRLGEYVAVKSIWNDRKWDEKLEKEFLAEVQILGTIRHSNIVKLLCCISSEKSKLLVYEYMENHSLDKWLLGKRRRSAPGMMGLVPHVVLDWPTRMQIAIGAAQGLSYMHHDCTPPIIHRDVKCSNILLDSEFKARIADFGLAKISTKNGETHTASCIAGSFGYIAPGLILIALFFFIFQRFLSIHFVKALTNFYGLHPEYAYTTKVNEKIDVYSFGVVLLELATGKEPNSGDENMNLAEWAWQHYSDEKPIPDALDEEIKKPCYLEEMTSLFKLGLICTSTLPSSRPTMKEVLQILRWNGPSSEAYETKKVGREFDVTPLLGLGNAKYLASYRRSKKVSQVEDDSLEYSV